MITLKEIKKFISEYNVSNHKQACAKAEILIQKYPQNTKLLKVIGVIFANNKKFNDAITVFKKILDHNPQSIEALINVGVAYYESNKLDEALDYFEKAKSLDVKQSEVLYNLGLVYEKKNDIIKALTHFKQSVKSDPSNINALLNIGKIHLQNKDFKYAINAYENVLKLSPDDLNIYHNLGVTWTKLGKTDKAIDFYLKAVKLHSRNSFTYYNLGYLYLQNSDFALSKLKKSELNFQKAIAINSNTAKFFYNLAVVQSKLKKYDSAIENYKQSIEINPNYSSANYNLSRMYLAVENFKEGWPMYYQQRLNWYEKIEKKPWYIERVKNFLNLNFWDGEKFKGKLFVYGEQGIGDQILHSSMIPDLYKKHSDISLSVDDRLISLFKRSFKYINIHSYGKEIDTSTNDRHIPLLSLGPFLRKSINDFKPSPYIIPCRDKVSYFKKILPQNNKIKIGLSWRTQRDQSGSKSISLNNLSKILTLKNFEFINLQYGDTSEERKKFKSKFGTEIINIDNLDLMNDFEGLAALITNCDLVITISNATAQLSGSLGATTWIILPLYPYWEWFVKRSNSLWYPNVRLFRRINYESWENVIANIYGELLKKNISSH